MALFRRKATAESVVEDVERKAELQRLVQEKQLEREARKTEQELYSRKHPVRTFAAKIGKRIMEAPARAPRAMPSPFVRGAEAFTHVRIRKSKPGRKGAGRPRGTYKYFILGKGGVPVKVYKRFLRQQRVMSQMAMQRVQPQIQSAQRITQEMPQMPIQPQVQTQPVVRAGYGVPYTPPASEMPIPRSQTDSDYYVDVDLMTSRRRLIRRPPREAWTR